MSFADPNWLLQAPALIPGPLPAWALLGRLGEAQLLLPAMAAAVLWLLRTPANRPLAAAWVVAVLAAALLTTVSKVAFIGWGVGYAPLDFSGLSGHSMFAAAVLPVLMRLAAGHAAPPWPRLAIAAGYALALLIAVSRLKTGAHSLADTVPGFALGALASAASMRFTHAPRAPTPAWLAAGLAAWLLVLPFNAPASRSHDWVTQLSLQVSGRNVPYTRQQMRRAHHIEKLRQRSLESADRRLPTGQVQADPAVQRQIGGHGIR
jgi:membrane-associated phospholipid phosphatase